MLIMIVYLGVIIYIPAPAAGAGYIISLAGRLVRAVEKIADKFEKRAPLLLQGRDVRLPTESANL